MNGAWIKVVLFILGVTMLSGIVMVLLDPGLGKPDDARRTRHMSGFSISYPLGWGGSTFGGPHGGGLESIRLAPERKAGRETSINVACTGLKPETVANAVPGTFQGLPAFFSSDRGKWDWRWRVQFERDATWYQITLVSPIELDVQKSTYWPFIESFRVEKPLSPTTVIVPTTQPLIIPVNP